MKKIFSLLIMFLLVFSVLTNCYATDVNIIDNTNTEQNVVTTLDLYNIFYLIACILVTILLYIFLSDINRIR